ncbi:MAG: bifunctional DNA-formamidopyrimidine glycosylase/DNA-(apurinic or apyrimidinic site) lyase [Bacilli bacterium]
MPELPEVETVKNTLKEFLLQRTIKNINIRYSKIIRNITEEDFCYKLIEKKVTDINRIGKYLIIELDDIALITHLRMEGKFYYRNECFLSKHDHICFQLDNNMFLVYNDTRKFGTMNIETLNSITNVNYIKKLGLEPSDKRLTSEYLFDKISNKKIAIKTALLDQTIISGLGNIYADEVLFESKIYPTTKCCNISHNNCKSIIENAKLVVDKAIKAGGTTIKSYTSSEGVHGKFQNYLNVHTKNNCAVCGGEITKIKVNGRGTYYCKKCQG